MRITCGRCGKDRVLSETHANAMRHARDIVFRMRHDGCGGGQGRSSS
jgi:hypothetical protein